MDEDSQIQKESDVPEIPSVTLCTSPRHSGKNKGKTEKNRGLPQLLQE